MLRRELRSGLCHNDLSLIDLDPHVVNGQTFSIVDLYFALF